MTTELTKAAQQALEALESASNGLTWYQQEHPEDDSHADEEMHEALNQAMRDLRNALTQRPAAQEVPAFSTRVQAFNNGYSSGYQAGRASLPAPQQATPEPVTLGPLAKRNIYDAIRGAYDLGYNDARNARTVPGDSAPGYDGRSVEEDHGGALFNLLSRRLKPATPPQQAAGEPVYQYQRGDGSWIDQTKASYDYNVEHGQAIVRVVYTHPAPGVPEVEPVAIIGSGWTFFWASGDAIADIVKRHGLKIGDKLYTRSAPGVPEVHVAEAVKEAVAAIYFADSSDYKPALWSVVRVLAPDLYDMLETNESAAYHQADARLAAAQAKGGEQ